MHYSPCSLTQHPQPNITTTNRQDVFLLFPHLNLSRPARRLVRPLRSLIIIVIFINYQRPSAVIASLSPHLSPFTVQSPANPSPDVGFLVSHLSSHLSSPLVSSLPAVNSSFFISIPIHQRSSSCRRLSRPSSLITALPDSRPTAISFFKSLHSLSPRCASPFPSPVSTVYHHRLPPFRLLLASPYAYRY